MTLEDILNLLGSENSFLRKIKVDDEGHKQPFTESGAMAYSKLIDYISAADSRL